MDKHSTPLMEEKVHKGCAYCFAVIDNAVRRLFLDRVLEEQETHDEGNEGWDDGEERPDHCADRLLVGDGDQGGTCVGVGGRNQTSPT